MPRPDPSPTSSPRRRPRPNWPSILGASLGLAGVFIAAFYIGLNGKLPGLGPQESGAAAQPAVEAPTAPDPQPTVKAPPVRVKELAAESGVRPTSRPHRRPEGRPAAPPPKPSGDVLAPEEPPARQEPEDAGARAGSGDPQPADAKALYVVEAGAYSDEASAKEMTDRLSAAGYGPTQSTITTSFGRTYRVTVGPYPERVAAEEAVRELGQQGIPARMSQEP